MSNQICTFTWPHKRTARRLDRQRPMWVYWLFAICRKKADTRSIILGMPYISSPSLRRKIGISQNQLIDRAISLLSADHALSRCHSLCYPCRLALHDTHPVNVVMFLTLCQGLQLETSFPLFPVVDPDTKLETLRHLLDEYHAVLVDKGNKDYGIVTKHDLLKAMKSQFLLLTFWLLQ